MIEADSGRAAATEHLFIQLRSTQGKLWIRSSKVCALQRWYTDASEFLL